MEADDFVEFLVLILIEAYINANEILRPQMENAAPTFTVLLPDLKLDVRYFRLHFRPFIRHTRT